MALYNNTFAQYTVGKYLRCIFFLWFIISLFVHVPTLRYNIYRTFPYVNGTVL